MTTAKHASVFGEAILVTMVFAPFYLWRLPAALWEAGAFSLRFQRGYGRVLGAVLRANAAGGALGGLLMFGICLLVHSRLDADWLFEWEQAFGFFAHHPWLQLFGTLAYLGIYLLLTTRLESALLLRSPALAGIDDAALSAFRRRLHYVSFGIIAVLVGWRCWYFLQHPPIVY